MREIKHQTQPTSNSCVSTCIAMILEVPVENVIKEFHDDYQCHRVQLNEFLAKENIIAIPLLSTYKVMLPGKLYLVAVPSLNHKSTFHQIIIDMRSDYIELYDPNKGKENTKYYSYEDEEDEKAYPLKGFILEFEVILN